MSWVTQLEHELRDAGGQPVRRTRHGTLWQIGPYRLLVNKHKARSEPRSERNTRAAWRRIQARAHGALMSCAACIAWIRGHGGTVSR